jgi:hypothetical protein
VPVKIAIYRNSEEKWLPVMEDDEVKFFVDDYDAIDWCRRNLNTDEFELYKLSYRDYFEGR